MENENSRGFKKGEYTRRVLKLNDRPALVEGRKAAREEYLNLLKQYIFVKKAIDFEALKKAVHGFPAVNEEIPFVQEKQNIITSIERKIKSHRHPTVWHELVRQRQYLSDLNTLFLEVPEVILW